MAQSNAMTNAFALREILYTNDPNFGVVGDGVTDDSAAMAVAIAAATAKTLVVVGTPLLKSTLTISNPIRLVFAGNISGSGSQLGAHFIKHSSLAGTAVIVTAPSFTAEGGGVVGQPGNTGDGIRLQAVKARWSNPYVEGCGQDGIRLGNDSGTAVVSGIVLVNPICLTNGRHGIHCYDWGNNGNDHILVGPLCQTNTGDGIHFTPAFGGGGGNLLVLNMHCQSNTGWGYYDGGGSRNTCILGDCEQNGAGPFTDVYIDAAASGAMLFNLGTSAVPTNGSSSTTIINANDSDGAWNKVRLPVNGPVQGQPGATGTTFYDMMSMDANQVVQMGNPSVGTYVSMRSRPAANFPAAHANLKGVVSTDATNAQRLVFYDGVTGARCYITATGTF